MFIDEFVDMVMNKNVVKQNNYIAMLAAKSSQDYHYDKVCYTFLCSYFVVFSSGYFDLMFISCIFSSTGVPTYVANSQFTHTHVHTYIQSSAAAG